MEKITKYVRFSIPWLGSFAALLILFVLMGASESMGLPSINAIAVEKGRDMGMGSVMGISNMAMSLGLVVGSIFGGLIEDFRGIISVFPAAAVLGVAGIVAFNIFMLRSGRLPERVSPGFQPDIERSASEKPGDTRDG
ncbi:MAG: MFS transporter [Dehalococcoidia bacterium]